MSVRFPVLLPVLALLAQATARANSPTVWNGSSEIQFSGTSTLHDWSGTVPAKPFSATVTLDDAGQPSHLAARVEVHAVKMDTSDAKRDENMRKSMRVVDFPLITADFDCPFSQILPTGGKTPAKLPFTLALLGKKHRIIASISHWVLKDATATFDLDFELSLKECGIDVPSVLLVIRVGDTVKLHAQVTLLRARA